MFQDSTQSWGVISAQQFEAEYQIIAWSGAGQSTNSTALSRGIPENAYPTIPELFARQVASDSMSAEASFSNFIPQVI